MPYVQMNMDEWRYLEDHGVHGLPIILVRDPLPLKPVMIVSVQKKSRKRRKKEL